MSTKDQAKLIEDLRGRERDLALTRQEIDRLRAWGDKDATPEQRARIDLDLLAAQAREQRQLESVKVAQAAAADLDAFMGSKEYKAADKRMAAIEQQLAEAAEAVHAKMREITEQAESLDPLMREYGQLVERYRLDLTGTERNMQTQNADYGFIVNAAHPLRAQLELLRRAGTVGDTGTMAHPKRKQHTVAHNKGQLIG